jgi:hypothetical protein
VRARDSHDHARQVRADEVTAPFWTDGRRSILHGDCRAVMTTDDLGGFRTVITDPPHWGARLAQAVRLGVEPYDPHTEANWVVGLQEFYLSWMPIVHSIVESTKGRAWIFLPTDNAPTFLRLADIAHWPLQHFWYAPDQYVLAHFGRPVPPRFTARIGAAFRESLHPAQIDRAILDAILVTAEGPILDPFMGAGGTLAAAGDHGFRVCGIEEKLEMCEQAKQRFIGDTLTVAGPPSLVALPGDEPDSRRHKAEDVPAISKPTSGPVL